MKDFKLNTATLAALAAEVGRLITTGKAYRVSIVEWQAKRSPSINAQQHVFYNQIAKHYGDRSSLDVKNFCKDAFGLPILLNSAEHGDKMAFLLDKLDYYRHSYESKIKLVSCLEVSSLFKTAEAKLYTDNMIHYFNDIGVMIDYENRT